jgi:arabinogalactan oligomer/maltooligosaccharide transport system substrate-binding protein
MPDAARFGRVASLCVAAVLGACGAEVADPRAVIVLWHGYRAGEQVAIEQVVERFNASQDRVVVRAQAIPSTPFADKVTISVPRGQGPDVFIFAHDKIGTWVEKGVLEPLAERVSEAELAPFVPQSVRALVYLGNLYGLPLSLKTLVMFYNKALLPAPPPTMEGLIEAVKPLQVKGKRHGIVYQAGSLFFHAMWIHAFGGALFDDRHEPALDSEAQVEALDFVRSLHLAHGVLPAGVNGFMVTSLFNQGDAAVVFNGPWFRAEIAGVDYGIAPIPTVRGAVPRPLLTVEAVFVSKTSRHKDAAIEFAKFLAGFDAAKTRLELGKVPVAHRQALEDGAASDPSLRVWMEQAERSEVSDASPEMQQLWGPADNAIAAGIFDETRSPRDQLEKAQRRVLAELARGQGGPR